MARRSVIVRRLACDQEEIHRVRKFECGRTGSIPAFLPRLQAERVARFHVHDSRRRPVICSARVVTVEFPPPARTGFARAACLRLLFLARSRHSRLHYGR